MERSNQPPEKLEWFSSRRPAVPLTLPSLGLAFLARGTCGFPWRRGAAIVGAKGDISGSVLKGQAGRHCAGKGFVDAVFGLRSCCDRWGVE